MDRRYLIISPCRDEAEHLTATIRSIAAQSAEPTKWIIVDDGSSDDTPRILAEAARQYPFIEIVRREDRGDRAVGPGVIDAFYAGLDRVNMEQYDYLCKLDADLELPPTYFQRIMERMEGDPMLGNFSGKIYLQDEHGRLTPERMGDENAVGAAKFYRTTCFREIGGFVRQLSWDGIDGHMCRMMGWVARSSDEQELRIRHRRQMGSSQQSIWTGRKRWGRGKYYMGSAPYYVLAVALYRTLERPYLIGGVGIAWGYLAAMCRGARRHDDPRYLKHLRRYERQSLIRGKRRTMRTYHQQIRERRGQPA